MSSNPTFIAIFCVLLWNEIWLAKSGAYQSCIRFYFKNRFQFWGNPHLSFPNMFVYALHDFISSQWHVAHQQLLLMKQLICEPQIAADELLLALLYAICAKRSIEKHYWLDNSHFLHVSDMLNKPFGNILVFLYLNWHYCGWRYTGAGKASYFCLRWRNVVHGLLTTS